MFQSILFFVLGFLSAAFLALTAAPAIWRRAVVLTRRRIEASVPLSMNEIQADKDRMRAEFAMSTRRLEMSVQALREKAAAQLVEINRGREDLKRLSGERDKAGEAIGGLEAQGGDLRAELAKRGEQLDRLNARLAETERQFGDRMRDLDALTRLYNDASMEASNRQIEVVARETEVEKLSGDVSMLRNQRRDQEKRLRDMALEVRTAGEALKAEKKRAADLETRLGGMMTALPEREERLERREKELARLREEVKLLTSSENELAERLTIQQTERLKLEAELADMSLRRQTIMNGADDDGTAKAAARLNAERIKLEERLTILARENKKLRENGGGAGAKPVDGGESTALRERIHDLAAEVVNLTLTLEGSDSPIRAALKPPANGLNGHGATAAEKALSIADRVRALQSAARPEA